MSDFMAGGLLSGLGSILGGLGSSGPSVKFAPPALGTAFRQKNKGEIGQILMALARGGGGFGPNFLGQAFGQAQSMMAPAMASANRRLDFANMRAGIMDSGVASQQRAQLQGGFLANLNRGLMDIVLQGEAQKRLEAMQGLQMLMGGIAIGQPYQQGGGMNATGVVGQGLFGNLGSALQTNAMMNWMGDMFKNQNQTQQNPNAGAASGAQYISPYFPSTKPNPGTLSTT